jgi:glyceraldehyde 3-phosphate dehydrogenase
VSVTRVAINGFGRVGRLALRAGWERDDLDFVHVNEPDGGPETGAHLLCFDSVHGRWDREARAHAGSLQIDGTSVAFTDASEPGGVGWEGVDVVL